MIGVRFPAGAGNFSLHHRVQNGSGPHPASYPMSTRGSFPGGKAEVKNAWSYTSISKMPSWRGAQLNKAQGQLYSTLLQEKSILQDQGFKFLDSKFWIL
jgi:hypothetical protein